MMRRVILPDSALSALKKADPAYQIERRLIGLSIAHMVLPKKRHKDSRDNHFTTIALAVVFFEATPSIPKRADDNKYSRIMY
jgi:hypothetical protein